MPDRVHPEEPMLPGAATGESGHTECSEAYDPANRSLGNTDRSRSPAQKLEEGEGDGEAGRLESILGPELDRLKLSEIPRVTDDLQPRQSSGVISPISTAQSKISGSSESHPVSPGPGENSGPALFRPGSNRRGSIDSIVKMVGNAKHSVRSVRKPKTDKILREPPEWLTPQLVRKTQIRLSTISSAKHIVALRSENAVRQTEQDSWAVLTWALGHPEEANEPLSGEELAEIVSSDKDMSTRSMPTSVAEKKIFEVMRKRQKAFCQKHGDGAEVGAVLMPGPVGDTPMHQCFLLGMVNLGKKIVEAFYFHPDLLNVPFANDLQVWCEQGVISQEQDDGGLYTGQTVLHLAINLKDHDLIDWLLSRGASIVSRARGRFFGPVRIRIRPGQDEKGIMRAVPSGFKKTRRQKILDWFVRVCGLKWNEALEQDGSVPRYRINEDSACYYGEFPLSFAASLGEPGACDLLCQAFRTRRHARDPKLQEFYEHMALRQGPEGENLKKQFESMTGADAVHPAFSKTLDCDYFSNAQDSYGNTALHMAVMHSNKPVIEWLCVNGEALPSLNILNEEGFTPLTLAIKNRDVKVFTFILKHIRLCSWTFGGVKLIKTPLDQIDTFRIPGHPLHKMKRWRSVLEILIEREVEEFANEKMLNNLVMDKWQRFGLRVYTTTFLIPYAVYLVMLTVSVYLRALVLRTEQRFLIQGLFEERSEWSYARWMAFMWERGSATQNQRVAASALQVCLIVLALPRLLRHAWQARRLRQEDFDPRQVGGVSMTQVIKLVHKNLLSVLLSVVGIMSVLAAVAGLIHKEPFDLIEMQGLSVAMMLMWSGLLICLMPFKFFGVLVITMWQMLSDGIFKFLVTYIVLVAAFSQSLYAMFQFSDTPEEMIHLDERPGRLFVKMIWVSLGDTRFIEEAIAVSPFPSFALVVYLIYVVLVMVLMLNLLIAMMGQAFQTYMANAHMTWFFPFAHLVCRMEKQLSEDEKAIYRSGRPGVIMTASPEGYKSATFFDIRMDTDETLRKNAKAAKSKKKQRLVLQAIESEIVKPLARHRDVIEGIVASLGRLQRHEALRPKRRESDKLP